MDLRAYKLLSLKCLHTTRYVCKNVGMSKAFDESIVLHNFFTFIPRILDFDFELTSYILDKNDLNFNTGFQLSSFYH